MMTLPHNILQTIIGDLMDIKAYWKLVYWLAN